MSQVLAISQVSKVRLPEIQEHSQGVAWVAQVRFPPRGRTEALSPYTLLLLPGSWLLQPPSLISTLPPPRVPIREVCSAPLPAPSGWLWRSSPIACVVGPVLTFSLPCPAHSRGGFKGSWDCWKSKGQKDMCVWTYLPASPIYVSICHIVLH